MDHNKTQVFLKSGGNILTSIGDMSPATIEQSVRIHHMAGMTIEMDRNEALRLLDFLREHETALLEAPGPEAL